MSDCEVGDKIMLTQLGKEKLTILINKVQNGDYIRASGNCLCSVCSRKYRDHPAWSEVGDTPFTSVRWSAFTLLCDNKVVKL